MTEAYQSPPHGAPPEREQSDVRSDGPQAQPAPAAAAPEAENARNTPDGAEHEAAPTEDREPGRFSIDAEKDRLVWSPPLPQYPARPARQEPVQYQAPRPQPAPEYKPQTYVPPHPAPPQSAQPPPSHPQSAPPPPAPQQAAPHPSMQQPAYAPAIASGYAMPVARPYDSYGQAVISPPMPKASKARVGRRMMRRTVRGLNNARKVIFEVRPGLVFAFLIVLALTGWFAYDKWLAGSGSPSATPNAANGGVVTLPPETATVQAYLTAVQKGDSDALWNSLGAQEKAHRISRGDDKSVLDAVLKAEQQQGFTYSAFHYVAGYGKDGSTDPSKGGIYFYIGEVGKGTQKTPVPMVFMMDDKGQISQVSDQLYDYVLQQLKGSGN